MNKKNLTSILLASVLTANQSTLTDISFNADEDGNLNPSIGFGIESLEVTDNITKKTTSEDKTIVGFGFKKKF